VGPCALLSRPADAVAWGSAYVPRTHCRSKGTICLLVLLDLLVRRELPFSIRYDEAEGHVPPSVLGHIDRYGLYAREDVPEISQP